MHELEEIIKNLNETLQPISNEINENLNILTDFLNEPNTFNFKEITMEEITEE